MIDASRGFMKDGNKNRLRSQDIHKIVDTFNKQVEIARYSRLVPLAEIEANDYNLNIPRYIDSAEPEDQQDIAAHLQGGIPNRDIDELGRYWQVFPGLGDALFVPAERPGYSHLKVALGDIKAAIFGHPEFAAFNQSVSALFETWRTASTPLLRGIAMGSKPKALIEAISESLLSAFRAAPLLDDYDVYQRLMDYWDETMQDDVYLLAQEGWTGVVDGKPNTDLIPPTLIIRRYFAAEAAAIEQYEAERDAIALQIEELNEEHAGEDSLLAEARNDKGRLTRASVRARLAA
jgi:type I restriction enzyme M protein